MYPARPTIVRKKLACPPVVKAINGNDNKQEATHMIAFVINDFFSKWSDKIPPVIFEEKPSMVIMAALIIAYSALNPGYDYRTNMGMKHVTVMSANLRKTLAIVTFFVTGLSMTSQTLDFIFCILVLFSLSFFWVFTSIFYPLFLA